MLLHTLPETKLLPITSHLSLLHPLTSLTHHFTPTLFLAVQVKDDSCGGTTHGSVWEQYAKMRDALNATGRPIWYMITQIVDYNDGRDVMHCIHPTPGCQGGNCRRFGAFSVRPWVQAGKDPGELANSFLAEYWSV